MILYSKLYEREGNDAWLKDYFEVVTNPIGLYLNHHVHHSGWNGDLKECINIELDSSDIDESQRKIDKYLSDNCFEDEIVINLNEILG